METDTDKKKPENKGETLVDEVFSWTLNDVLNRNLYKGKVAEIPMTFSSVSDYTKSFIYPLFEKTRADPLEFLVIDEAAQLKECESVIPLQLKGLRPVILVGDERQLPAMVQSKICEEAEFGRSLFERLVSLGQHLLNV